jgi:hypothetical protein
MHFQVIFELFEPILIDKFDFSFVDGVIRVEGFENYLFENMLVEVTKIH